GVDGTKHDVITISTAHDWNYASKPIGTRIKKGELMGHTGNAGMSTGDHLHIQLFNTNHHPWPSDDSQQLHLYDVFDTSNVKLWFRDGGYPWKEWDGSSDPDPDPDPNQTHQTQTQTPTRGKHWCQGLYQIYWMNWKKN